MPKKVAIVGAGRVGVACASLLVKHGVCEVALIDLNEEALRAAGVAVPTAETKLAESVDNLEATLKAYGPAVVICSTPFHVNIKVASICNKYAFHYVDFTEDVSVTKAIQQMGPARSSFVLQTGLAPGLVNSIGLDLCLRLQERGAKSESLSMRVGALPNVGSVPEAYSLTWSSAGLINEYYQPVEKIVDGQVATDQPLDDLEELIAGGLKFEAFNTSGGMGGPQPYLDLGLQNVDYKTMRYPGHLEFLQKRLMPELYPYHVAGDHVKLISEGIKLAERLFTFTRQDLVVMVVRARGRTPAGKVLEETFFGKWQHTPELTALELTTSGTGSAVVELLLNDMLPKGIVFGAQVPYELMAKTTSVGASFMPSEL